MSLGKYLQYYLLLIIVFFLCAFSFSSNEVIGGFVTLSITCLIVTLLASLLMLKSTRLRNVVIITFFLKLLIGVSHFLFFYDANYFGGDGGIRDVFQADFTSYFDYVQALSFDKESFGIFYYDSSRHVVSHQELLNFIAIFMYKFGVHAMNIVPLNCMFSSLFAINIYLCIEKVEIPNAQRKGLLLLLALFPLFLDDAIFVRDIVGQFVMSVGMALCLLSSNKNRLIWIIPASLLFYLQRTAYIVVPFVTYFTLSLINKKQSKYLIFAPILLLAAIYLMPDMGQDFGEEVTERASRGGMMSTSIAMLPLRVVFGLIGPFPWTQFITLGLIEPAYASQLYNYAAGVIHVGCLILLFTEKGLFTRLIKNTLFMTGLIIVAMGVVDSHMHITYIMAGTCFMVPIIYLLADKKKYNRAMLTSFLVMLALNILWIGLGLSGVKTGLI